MDMEREEGELTDEDLEDVSESSISEVDSLILYDNICREPFRELSLTSISDDSSDSLSVIEVVQDKFFPLQKHSDRGNDHKYQKRKRFNQECPAKRLKHVKDRYTAIKAKNHQRLLSSTSLSSSESEDCVPDKKILRQLRDAVRISSVKKNPNCSLRTRIKRMIEPASPELKNSDDEDLKNLRDQALKSKANNNNNNILSEGGIQNRPPAIADEDLTELRLKALQSAVLKKHENRRKRKQQQEEAFESKDSEKQTINSDNNVINENKSSESTGDNIRNDLSKSDAPAADLNQITNKPRVESDVDKVSQKTTPEEDEDILRAMLLTSISNKISRKITSKPVHKTDRILNVDSKPSQLSASVNKPSAPVKRLVINVNSDSESDSNNHSNPGEKKKGPVAECFEQDLSKLLKEARIKSDKQQQSDVSRHLPRSQQIEYRRLKRKLQQLSKKNSHLKFAKLNTNENKHVKLNSVSARMTKTPLVDKKQLGSKMNR